MATMSEAEKKSVRSMLAEVCRIPEAIRVASETHEIDIFRFMGLSIVRATGPSGDESMYDLIRDSDGVVIVRGLPLLVVTFFAVGLAVSCLAEMANEEENT